MISPGPRYPDAERRPVVDELHGHRVPDPYRWLEDPSDPASRRWLAAQDELWRGYAAGLPGLDWFRARVAELSEVGTQTPPLWRGPRQFFLRQVPGREHPVLYTVDPDGTERVLMDPMALDPQALTTLRHWQPDREGRRLAYQISRSGDEWAELWVLDVATGEPVDGPLPRCRRSPVAWLPGGNAFYYVRAAAQRPDLRGVYLHTLGTPADADVRILGSDVPPDGAAGGPGGAAGGPGGAAPPTGATTLYGLGTSPDGRWLTISASTGSARGADIWLADLTAGPPDRPRLRPVIRGRDGHTALTVGRDGRLYALTTVGAPRGKVCVGDPHRPEPELWRELVAPDPEAVIADFTILDGPQLARPVLLVAWTRHALGEISVHDLDSGARLGEVPLPGPGTIGSLSAHLDPAEPGAGHELWFSYTDAITPAAVYRYDARTGRTTLWAAAPGAPEPPRVRAHRTSCTSADGTTVPMVVLAPAATSDPGDPGDPDRGPRPAILHGYGGFGVPMRPSYSSYVLAWVQAGGVFATAAVRGGGDEGEQWHRDGMRDRKQNSFDDFVAAAEALVAGGWTTPSRLALSGESNGGLLVAATITRRPDVAAAAVCSKPVLDMVRYERFGLGPAWRGEYGSASDPQELAWLLSYSPYHHVRPGVRYPAVLFTVFGGDTRVDPLHARKMCAALQWATTGPGPILLRQEDGVGHGSRAASRAARLAADMLAFLAANTGLRAPAQEPAEEPARGASHTGARGPAFRPAGAT